MSLIGFNYIIENTLIIVVFVTLYPLIKHIYNNFQTRRRLPRGPIGLPFVGYSPFLGEKPYKTFVKLGEKYGNVFT